MSQMVNIPRDVDDPHYRYKMPVLRAKVEGRGNGIKTVVENMSDIAKALERRPDCAPSRPPRRLYFSPLGIHSF